MNCICSVCFKKKKYHAKGKCSTCYYREYRREYYKKNRILCQQIRLKSQIKRINEGKFPLAKGCIKDYIKETDNTYWRELRKWVIIFSYKKIPYKERLIQKKINKLTKELNILKNHKV